VEDDDLMSDDAVLAALSRHYRLSGQLTRIATEKDDSYRLSSPDGTYLVKVTAADETPEVVDLQISVMRFLEKVVPELPVQRVVPTLDGRHFVPLSSADGTPRSVRVLQFIDGVLLADVEPAPALLAVVGRAHARMTSALRSFTHPHQDRYVIWDLHAFSALRPLCREVLEPYQLPLADEIFDRFDREVTPRLPGLTRQQVHGDVSPFNVIISDDNPAELAGLIDFGDTLRSTVVFDLTVPLSNLLTTETAQPWDRAGAYLAGFLDEVSIPADEIGLLAATAPARLLLRVLLTARSAAGEPERRDYLLSHNREDWRNLEAAWAIPHTRIIRLLCSIAANPTGRS
jgi:hydroxylysine kinase